MVKEIQKADQTLFQCEECGLFYADKETAEKCEKWCRENQSCNLDIIKHAVKTDD